MRVALVLSGGKQYAPYSKYYEDLFQKFNIPFDVISWDRSGQISDDLTFGLKQSDSTSLLVRFEKLFSFGKYGRFITTVLKKNNYDIVIVFTIPIALKIKKYLFGNRIKYIFDIRDHSFLSYFFHKSLKKLLSNSVLNVSSSKGFESWLKANVVVCHNIGIHNLKIATAFQRKSSCSSINISSIGTFLEDGINKKLLSLFKNDEIIRFCYIGQETIQKQNLEKYVKRNGIKNVYFKGLYSPEETNAIYNNYCDFVNIVRKNSHINRWALPNKLYSGILLGKPILTNDANITLSKIVREYNLGIVITKPFNCANIKYQIINFNYDTFAAGRKKFITEIILEQEHFENCVLSCVKSNI